MDTRFQDGMELEEGFLYSEATGTQDTSGNSGIPQPRPFPYLMPGDEETYSGDTILASSSLLDRLDHSQIQELMSQSVAEISESVNNMSFRDTRVADPRLTANPLHYLTQQESLVDSKLQEYLNSQREVLQSGKELYTAQGHVISIQEIRSGISKSLESLEEIQTGLSELYVKEKLRRERVLNEIVGFEEKRGLLMKTVQDIRTGDSPEVGKLKLLSKERELVNEEIDSLEAQLEALKRKKTVLGEEITATESVIESRASSYLESLRELNTEEANVLSKWINEEQKSMRLFPLSSGALKIDPKKFYVSKGFSRDSDDDVGRKGMLSSSVIDLNPRKGLETILKFPSLVSRSFLRNIDKDVIAETVEEANSDEVSSFSEIPEPQVNVEIAKEELGSQITALDEQIAKLAAQKSQYEMNRTVWNDVTAAVSDMEKQVELIASAANPKSDVSLIEKELRKCLEILANRYEIAAGLGSVNLVDAVANEIDAISSALSLIITPNSNTGLPNNDESGSQEAANHSPTHEMGNQDMDNLSLYSDTSEVPSYIEREGETIEPELSGQKTTITPNSEGLNSKEKFYGHKLASVMSPTVPAVGISHVNAEHSRLYSQSPATASSPVQPASLKQERIAADGSIQAEIQKVGKLVGRMMGSRDSKTGKAD